MGIVSELVLILKIVLSGKVKLLISREKPVSDAVVKNDSIFLSLIKQTVFTKLLEGTISRCRESL